MNTRTATLYGGIGFQPVRPDCLPRRICSFHTGWKPMPRRNWKLASWRHQPTFDPRLPIKLMMTAVLVVCIGLFAYFLSTPFSRPGVQVLVIAPASDSTNDLDASQPNLDLASMLSTASSSHLQNSIGQACTDASAAPRDYSFEFDRIAQRDSPRFDESAFNPGCLSCLAYCL